MRRLIWVIRSVLQIYCRIFRTCILTLIQMEETRLSSSVKPIWALLGLGTFLRMALWTRALRPKPCLTRYSVLNSWNPRIGMPPKVSQITLISKKPSRTKFWWIISHLPGTKVRMLYPWLMVKPTWQAISATLALPTPSRHKSSFSLGSNKKWHTCEIDLRGSPKRTRVCELIMISFNSSSHI